MTDTTKLRALALAVRNTPWQPMSGMPTNILNSSGLRVARCDFDGDSRHSDAHANAAYIAAVSPDVVLALLDERDAALAQVDALTKDAERYQWLRNSAGDTNVGVYRYANDDKKRYWLEGDDLDDTLASQKKEQT